MKYKPCCGRTCLSAVCETRDSGGCYCICRKIDEINCLKATLEGTFVARGCVYIPDPEKRAEFLNNMSQEERSLEGDYLVNEAPRMLKELEEQLKEYLL